MSDDLARGRRTEIDYLQGVVADLAARAGIDVPLTRAVMRHIKAAEEAAAGSPRLIPQQIVAVNA
jgi:2-dehydropantoate 2-reductase